MMEHEDEKFDEELLKEDKGPVASKPDDTGGDMSGQEKNRRDLHVLTSVLVKYKALLFEPEEAELEPDGMDQQVEEFMRRSFRIRPGSKVISFHLLKWAAPLAVAATVLIVFLVSFYSPTPAHPDRSIAIISGIGVDDFVMRGMPDTISKEDIDALLHEQMIKSGFESGTHLDIPGLFHDDTQAVEDALGKVTERYAILVTEHVTAMARPALLLYLYDTKAQTPVFGHKVIVEHDVAPTKEDIGQAVSDLLRLLEEQE